MPRAKRVIPVESSPVTPTVQSACTAYGFKVQQVGSLVAECAAAVQHLHMAFIELQALMVAQNGARPTPAAPQARPPLPPHAQPGRSKRVAPPVPEPEPEEEEAPVYDFDNMSVDDLQDVIKRYELSTDLASPVHGGKLLRKRLAVEEAYGAFVASRYTSGSSGEEEDEDEDEDENLDAPLDFENMSLQALRVCIEDNDLHVDLDDRAYQGNINRQRIAVEDAFLAGSIDSAQSTEGEGNDEDESNW